MSKSKTIYFSCRQDDEYLRHTCPDDAIEAFLDDLGPDPFPEEIKLYSFTRCEIPESEIVDLVDQMLETLCSRYGDPEGFGSILDEESASTLRKVASLIVRSNAEVWTCECSPVFRTVKVADWVREHRPDLLEERTGHE